jgi:predicted nucleic acid-binding protein
VKEAVIADTGPLIASLDPDDSHHQRATRELERLADESNEVVVPMPIVLGTYTLAMRRMGSKAALHWLREIETAPLLNPTSEDYRQAGIRLEKFADQSITMFDATLAILAQRLGLRVWTYDHHFDVMQIPVWR